MNNFIIFENPEFIYEATAATNDWQRIGINSLLSAPLPNDVLILIVRLQNTSGGLKKTGIRSTSGSTYGESSLRDNATKEVYVEIEDPANPEIQVKGREYNLYVVGYITSTDSIVIWEGINSYIDTNETTHNTPSVPSFLTSVALLRVRNPSRDGLSFKYWNSEEEEPEREYKLFIGFESYLLVPVDTNGKFYFRSIGNGTSNLEVDYLASFNSSINLKAIRYSDSDGYIDYINNTEWTPTSVYGNGADLTYLETHTIPAGVHVDKLNSPDIQGAVSIHYTTGNSYYSDDGISDISSTGSTASIFNDPTHHLIDCGTRTSVFDTNSGTIDSFYSKVSTNGADVNGEIRWIITGISTSDPGEISPTILDDTFFLKNAKLITTVNWEEENPIVDYYKIIVTNNITSTTNTHIVDDSKPRIDVQNLSFDTEYSVNIEGYSAGYLIERGSITFNTPSIPLLSVNNIPDVVISDSIVGSASVVFTEEEYTLITTGFNLEVALLEDYSEINTHTATVDNDNTSFEFYRDLTNISSYTLTVTLYHDRNPVIDPTTGNPISSSVDFDYYIIPTPQIHNVSTGETIESKIMSFRCSGLENYPDTTFYKLIVEEEEYEIYEHSTTYVDFTNIIDEDTPYKYTDEEDNLDDQSRRIKLELKNSGIILNYLEIFIQNRPPGAVIRDITHTELTKYSLNWDSIDTNTYPISYIRVEYNVDLTASSWISLPNIEGGPSGTEGSSGVQITIEPSITPDEVVRFRTRVGVNDSIRTEGFPESEWKEFDWIAEEAFPAAPLNLIQTEAGASSFGLGWDYDTNTVGPTAFNVYMYDYAGLTGGAGIGTCSNDEYFTEVDCIEAEFDWTSGSSGGWFYVNQCFEGSTGICHTAFNEDNPANTATSVYNLEGNTVYRVAVTSRNSVGSSLRHEASIQAGTTPSVFSMNIEPAFYSTGGTFYGPESSEGGALKLELVEDSNTITTTLGTGLSPGVNINLTLQTCYHTVKLSHNPLIETTDRAFLKFSTIVRDSSIISGFGLNDLTGITGGTGSIVNHSGMSNSETPDASNWTDFSIITHHYLDPIYFYIESDSSLLNPNTSYGINVYSTYDFSYPGQGSSFSNKAIGISDTISSYSFSLVPDFSIENIENNVVRFQIGNFGYNPVGTLHLLSDDHGNNEVHTFINDEEIYIHTGSTFSVDAYNREYTYYLDVYNEDNIKNSTKQKEYTKTSLAYIPGIPYIGQDTSGSVTLFINGVPLSVTHDNLYEVTYAFEFEVTGASSGFVSNNNLVLDVTLNDIDNDSSYWISSSDTSLVVNGLSELTAYNVKMYSKNSAGEVNTAASTIEFNSLGPPITGFHPKDYTNNALKVGWNNYIDEYGSSFEGLSDPTLLKYYVEYSEDNETYEGIIELNGEQTETEEYNINPLDYKYFKIYAKYNDEFTTESVIRKFYHPLHSPENIVISHITSDSSVIDLRDPTDFDLFSQYSFINSVSYKFLFTEINTGTTFDYVYTPVGGWYAVYNDIPVSGLTYDTEYNVEIAGGLEYFNLGSTGVEYGKYSEGVTFTTREQGWTATVPLPPAIVSIVSDYSFEDNKQRFNLTWQDNSEEEIKYQIWSSYYPYTSFELSSSNIAIGASGLIGNDTSLIDTMTTEPDTNDPSKDFILISGASYSSNNSIFKVEGVNPGSYINLSADSDELFPGFIPESGATLDITVIRHLYDVVIGADAPTGERQHYIDKAYNANRDKIDLLSGESYKHFIRGVAEGSTGGQFTFSNTIPIGGNSGTLMNLIPFSNLEIGNVEGTSTRLSLTFQNNDDLSSFTYPISVYTRSDEFSNNEYETDSEMIHNHLSVGAPGPTMLVSLSAGQTYTTIETTGYSTGGTGLLIPGSTAYYQFGAHAGFPNSPHFISSNIAWSNEFTMPSLPEITFIKETQGATSIDVFLFIDDFGIEFDIYQNWEGVTAVKLNSTPLGATAHEHVAYNINGGLFPFTSSTEYTFTAVPVTVDRGATLYNEVKNLTTWTVPIAPTLSINSENNEEVVVSWDNPNPTGTIYDFHVVDVLEGVTYTILSSGEGITYSGAGSTYGAWGDPSAGITLGTVNGENLVPNREYSFHITSHVSDFSISVDSTPVSAYTVPYSPDPILTVGDSVQDIDVLIDSNNNSTDTSYVLQNEITYYYYDFTSDQWTGSFTGLGRTAGEFSTYGTISELSTNHEYIFKVYPIYIKTDSILSPGVSGSIYTKSAPALNPIATPTSSTGILLEWENNDTTSLLDLNLDNYHDYTLTGGTIDGATYSENETDPFGGTAAIHLEHSLTYPEIDSPKMYIDSIVESLTPRSAIDELSFYIKQGNRGEDTRISLYSTFAGFLDSPTEQRFDIDLEWSGASLTSATASQSSTYWNPPDIAGLTYDNIGNNWYKITLETEGQEDNLISVTNRKLEFNFNNLGEIVESISVNSNNYTCAGGGTGATCDYLGSSLPINTIIMDLRMVNGGSISIFDTFKDQGFVKVADNTGYVQTLSVIDYDIYSSDIVAQGGTNWYRVQLEIDPSSWDHSQGTHVPINTDVSTAVNPSDFYLYNPILSVRNQSHNTVGITDFNAINITTGASSGFIEGATSYQFNGLTGGTSYQFKIESSNEEGIITTSATATNSTHAIEVEPPVLSATDSGNLGVTIVDNNPSDTLYAIYVIDKEDNVGATSAIDEYVSSDGTLNGATAVWRSKLDWNGELLPNGNPGVDVELNEYNYKVNIKLLAKTENETPIESTTVGLYTLTNAGYLNIEMGTVDNGILINHINTSNNASYTQYAIQISQVSGDNDPIIGGSTAYYLDPNGSTYVLGDGAIEYGFTADFLNKQLTNLKDLTVYQFDISSKNEDSEIKNGVPASVLSHPASFNLTSAGVDSYTIEYTGSFTNLNDYFSEDELIYDIFNSSPYLYFETVRDGTDTFYSGQVTGSTFGELNTLYTGNNLLENWENSSGDYTINLGDNLGNHNIVTKMYLNSNFKIGALLPLGHDGYIGATAEIYTDVKDATMNTNGINGIHPAIGLFSITNGPLSGFTGYTPNPLFDSEETWCVNPTDYNDISLKGSTSECYVSGGLNTPDYLHLGICDNGSTFVSTPDECGGTFTSTYTGNLPYDYFTWTEVISSGPTMNIEVQWNSDLKGYTGVNFDAEVWDVEGVTTTSSSYGITADFSNNYSVTLNVPASTLGFQVRIYTTNSDTFTSVAYSPILFTRPGQSEWSVSGFTSDSSSIIINTTHATGDQEQYRLYSNHSNSYIGWYFPYQDGITFTDSGLVSNKTIQYDLAVRNRNDWAEPVQSVTGPFYTEPSLDYKIETVNTDYSSINYSIDRGLNDTSSTFIIKVEDSGGTFTWVDATGILGVTMENLAPSKTKQEWENIIGPGVTGIHSLNSGSFYKAYISIIDTQGNVTNYKPVIRQSENGYEITDTEMLEARKYYGGVPLLTADSNDNIINGFNYNPHRTGDVVKYEPELISNDFAFSNEGYIEDKHERFGYKHSLKIVNVKLEISENEIDELIRIENDPLTNEPLNPLGVVFSNSPAVIATKDEEFESPVLTFPTKEYLYMSKFPLINILWASEHVQTGKLYKTIEEIVYHTATIYSDLWALSPILDYPDWAQKRYLTPWKSHLGANQWYTAPYSTEANLISNEDWCHVIIDGAIYTLLNKAETLNSISIKKGGNSEHVLLVENTHYTYSIVDGILDINIIVDDFSDLGISNTDNIRTVLDVTMSYYDTLDFEKGTCTPFFLNNNGDKGVVNVESYGEGTTGYYPLGVVTSEEECCEEHAGGNWDEDATHKCGVCIDPNNGNFIENKTSESECDEYEWVNVLGMDIPDLWSSSNIQKYNAYNENNPDDYGYCSSNKVSFRHGLSEYDDVNYEGLFTTREYCCEEVAGGTYEPNNEECSGVTDWGWSSVVFKFDQLVRVSNIINEPTTLEANVLVMGDVIGANLSTHNTIEVKGTQYNDGLYSVDSIENSDLIEQGGNDIVCKNTTERLHVTRLTGNSTIINEKPTEEVSIKVVPLFYRLKNSQNYINGDIVNPHLSSTYFSVVSRNSWWTKPYSSSINHSSSKAYQLGVTFDNPNSNDTYYSVKVGRNNYIKLENNKYISTPSTLPFSIMDDETTIATSLGISETNLPVFYQKYSEWNNGDITLKQLNPNWNYNLYLEGKTPEYLTRGEASAYTTSDDSWNSSILDLSLSKIMGIDVSKIEQVMSVTEHTEKHPRGNYYYDSDGDLFNDGDVHAIAVIHQNAIQNSDNVYTATGDSVPEEWCADYVTLDETECLNNGGSWRSINDTTKLNGTVLDGRIEYLKLGDSPIHTRNSIYSFSSVTFWKHNIYTHGAYQHWNEQRGIRLEAYRDPLSFTSSSDLNIIGLWDRITSINFRTTVNKIKLPSTIGNLFQYKPYVIYSGCSLLLESNSSIDFPDEISKCKWLTSVRIPNSYLSNSLLSIGGDKKSSIEANGIAYPVGVDLLNEFSVFNNPNLILQFYIGGAIINKLPENICDSDTYLSIVSHYNICASIDNTLPSCLESDNEYGIIPKTVSIKVESSSLSEDFTENDITIVPSMRTISTVYQPEDTNTQTIDMSPLDVNDYQSNFPDDPFIVEVGATSIVNGASALAGQPYWDVDSTSDLIITYGATMFEGSFDLHIESGVSFTSAKIEITGAVNLTGITYDSSLAGTVSIQDNEDILISANWFSVFSPGNYNMCTVFFNADNQGSSSEICFNTNIHPDDTSITYLVGNSPTLLGASYIEFGATCSLLQSATAIDYNMSAGASALISFGDINITNDPNDDHGFSGETINITYIDHDYQINLSHTPLSINNIYEGEEFIEPNGYTLDGSYINFYDLDNEGGTITVSYESNNNSLSYTLPNDKHPIPLYSIGRAFNLPSVYEHNTSIPVILEIATLGSTFNLYSIPSEYTGATLDIKYYEQARSGSTSCNDHYIGYELDNEWPLPTINISELSTVNSETISIMTEFYEDLISLNAWDGFVKGDSRVYDESKYNNLQEAMDNALPLSNLPCSSNEILGSPGMQNGSCHSDSGTLSFLYIYSLQFPLNFVATRDYWRPVIFDDEGYVTHLSLNFNGQMKYLSSSITSFERLEVLNLENNGYGSTADIVLYDWIDDNDHSAGVTASNLTLSDDITIIV